MTAKRRPPIAAVGEHDIRRYYFAEWLFYCLGALTPIAFCLGSASPTTVKILIVSVLAIPILVLLCREISSGLAIPKSALLLPAVTMFAWKVISAVYGGHFYSSAEPLADATVYLIFFLGAAILLRRHEQRVRVLTVVAYGAVPVAVFGILEHYGIRVSRLSDESLGRIFSTMGNPTFLAAYLALLLPVQIGLFCLTGRKTRRWALGVIAAVCYLCVIWTYTRGIWLGLMVSAVVMALLLARSSAKEAVTAHRKQLAILAIILTAVTVFAWGTHQVLGAKSRQAENTKFAMRESDTIRKTLMGAGVAMFQRRPVLGWGLGGYRAFQLNFISRKPVQGKYDMGEDHAHNDLIETAADQGLPGIAIYAWFLAAIGLLAAAALRRAGSHADPARALVVIVVVGGIIAYFGDVMVNVSIHEVYVGVFFWLLLGTLAGLSAANEETKPERVRKPFTLVAGSWTLGAILAMVILYYGMASFRADLHTYRAGVARDRGDAQTFLKENQVALKAYPFATRAMYWVGMAYLDAGYPEDALTALCQYQKRYPRAMRIDYELGRTYFALHEDGAAIDSYRSAVRFDPDNFAAWLGLATACSATGKVEMADEAAAKAVSLGSDASIASYYESAPLRVRLGLGHYLTANDLLRAGRYEVAVSELRKAVNESPKSVDYLTVLGAAYLQMARAMDSDQVTHSALTDAEQAFRSAIAIDDHAVDAHGYLASIYLMEGRKTEAHAELDKAITLTADQTRLTTFKQMLRQTE